MKKSFLLFLMLFVSIFLVCCGTSKEMDKPGSFPEDPSPSPSFVSDKAMTDGEFSGRDPSTSYESEVLPPKEGEGEEENYVEPRAGQLTSSVVFDNDKYDFWKSLITKGQEEGAFYKYMKKYPFDSSNRIKVTVPGVCGAKVVIDNKFIGKTDSNGVVYLFPTKADSYSLVVTFNQANEQEYKFEQTITEDYTLDLTGIQAKAKNDKIQIMLILDTTGSMGDEIAFLKSELKNVINQVKKDLGNITIELSLVFYRDFGDDYVTLTTDFSTDIDKMINELSKQYADGGGDWEEAVHEAFKAANKQSWDEDAKTKLLIWVADAPCHDDDAKVVKAETEAFAEKGIRVITVASSGIDKATEFLFRSICIETNGCYGYLTNDSGIGNEHVEATTEEKPTVEYLNKMLVRIIKGFYTGTFEEAIAWRGQE